MGRLDTAAACITRAVEIDPRRTLRPFLTWAWRTKRAIATTWPAPLRTALAVAPPISTPSTPSDAPCAAAAGLTKPWPGSAAASRSIPPTSPATAGSASRCCSRENGKKAGTNTNGLEIPHLPHRQVPGTPTRVDGRGPRRKTHHGLHRAGLRRRHPVRPLPPAGRTAAAASSSSPRANCYVSSATWTASRRSPARQPARPLRPVRPMMTLPGLFDSRVGHVPPATATSRLPTDIRNLWASAPRRARPCAAIASVARVGIVWAGRPEHENDRHRSLPVALFAALGRIPVESLPFGSEPQGRRQVERPGVPLPEPATRRRRPTSCRPAARGKTPDVMEGVADFLDTAGLIDQLDLLITWIPRSSISPAPWGNPSGPSSRPCPIGAG